MGSNAKKKTTMSKLNREHKLREKRQDKQMRKEERRRAAANGETPRWELPEEAPTAAEAV
jgi:hypothetical protein